MHLVTGQEYDPGVQVASLRMSQGQATLSVFGCSRATHFSSDRYGSYDHNSRPWTPSPTVKKSLSPMAVRPCGWEPKVVTM